MPADVAINILRTYHEKLLWVREYVSACDKSGDGFIVRVEFEFLIQIYQLHYPVLINKAYDEFVAEADTNRDGKVSIDAKTVEA